jgi:hypothetical protein
MFTSLKQSHCERVSLRVCDSCASRFSWQQYGAFLPYDWCVVCVTRRITVNNYIWEWSQDCTVLDRNVKGVGGVHVLAKLAAADVGSEPSSWCSRRSGLKR